MASSDLSKSARERLERQRIDQRYRLGRTTVRATASVACVWLIGQAIGELAGQDTSVAVSAALSVFASLKFVFTLTLAGSAVAWAVVERKLRHRKVEYLQNRVKYLEQYHDPKRSTSGLTPKGKTNPRDKG